MESSSTQAAGSTAFTLSLHVDNGSTLVESGHSQRVPPKSPDLVKQDVP